MPCSSNVNVVQFMWIFKIKTKSDGFFERHKAHLVCDGRS